MKKILPLFFILIAILLFNNLIFSNYSSKVFAQNRTITVCPDGQSGCDYTGTAGIQQAIDAANSGDTVLIKSGTYNSVNVVSGYVDVNGKFHPAKQNVVITGENQQTILNGSTKCQQTGIINFAQSANITISNLKIQNSCVYGIYIFAKSTGIIVKNNVVVNDKGIGIYFSEGSSGTMSNNIVDNTSGFGIIATYNDNNVTIINNTIYNTEKGSYYGNGIDCGDGDTTSHCVVKNNISLSNAGTGIIGTSKNSFTNLTYNDSHNNRGGNYNAFPNWPPKTNLQIGAKFVDAGKHDFHLQLTSPLRNVGDPSILNPDGSRSDMGAYGGPGACGLDSSLPGCTGLTATPTPNPSITITSTPSPTITPGGPTLTPTPTVNPNCVCKSDESCDSSCTFDTYSDVLYNNPIKCSREVSIVGPTPDPTTKTSYCQRNERTKGDADGDGVVSNLDYFYYVSAVNGGGVPANVDADFNGDGKVSPSDRAIIVKTLGL